MTSSKEAVRPAARGPAWAWTVGCVLVVGLVFVGSLDNELVNWDDGIYIANNPMVTDPGRASFTERLATRNLGYPLPLPVWLYGLVWGFGGRATAFHGLSLAIHLVNVLLFQRLLSRELDSPKWAAAAALAFAVHPIVVEPVAWATGLKDLLVATGALLALHGLRRASGLLLPGTLVALLSKPAAALLGFALPLFLIGRDLGGRRVGRIVSFATAAVAGAGTVVFAKLQETPELQTTADTGFSATRVFGALGLQAQHLLVPASLAPRYPLASVTLGHTICGVLIVLGTGYLGWRLWKARSPALGWLALAVAIYLPTSNIIPLIRYTADSYVYVPWMACVAAAAHGWAAKRETILARAGRSARLLAPAGLVFLLAWSLLSFLQVETWASTRTLWQEAAERYPDDGELIYRYGDALGRDGEPAEELAVYLEHREALAGAPKIPVALPLFFEAEGDLDEASRWYALGFDSDVKQDHGFYWHYVEFVAKYPERHVGRRDAGLAHALGVYAETLQRSRLDAHQLERVAEASRRVGRMDLVPAIRGEAARRAGAP